MGFTRQEFVESGFEEIGFAAYTFDLSPELLQGGVKRLNSMMAEWNGAGIRLGFPIGSGASDGVISEQTYVPDWANEAIITNLAIRLAPMLGKTVAMETKVAAKNALNVVLARLSSTVEMQLPGSMPSGAGNKPRDGYVTFLPAPNDPILAGPSDVLSFD